MTLDGTCITDKNVMSTTPPAKQFWNTVNVQNQFGYIQNVVLLQDSDRINYTFGKRDITFFMTRMILIVKGNLF